MKINFRPFLFIFACTVCGILFALVAYYLLPLGIALLALFGLSVAVFGVIYTLKKDYVKTATAIIAIAVLLCTSLVFLTVANSRKESAYNGKECVITGRVTEHYEYSDGVFEAVLDDLVIDGNAESGKISAYLYGADDSFYGVRTGYSLTFTATVTDNPPIDDNGINASFVRSGVRYSAFSYEMPDVIPGTGNTLEKIRLGLREHLVGAMGENAGYLAYGMIAGDRYMISDEISDSFSKSGIGHILAVSGLHVGLIFLILGKLFSLIPIPKSIGRTATILLLVLYAVFTGGSPSTVRAVIMCVIVIWAGKFGKPDILNSLCLAATVCLCISPFYLFECGYLTSVGAVGGLVFFSKPIAAALGKIKLHKKVAGSIAGSVSVQIMITPIMAYYFHRVYVYSLPVNAVGMGLLSCLFCLLIVLLPFSFIFPVLLMPVGYVIRGLIFVTNAISMLPCAALAAQVSVAVFLIPVILFFATRFVSMPAKKYFSLIIFTLAIVILISADCSVKSGDGMIAAGGKTTATVIYNGNERYLFGDFADGRVAASAVDNARVGNERFIIYEYNLTDETAEGIVAFSRLRTVDEVRFVYNGDISGLKTLQRGGITVTMIATSDDNVTVATLGGKPCGFLYSSGETTVFIGQTQYYTAAINSADVVRVKSAPYAQNHPDKLFLPSRGDEAENVLVTTYKHNYFYDFKTGKTKVVC